MFTPSKALPPPPSSQKSRNSSLAASLASYRSRPNPSHTYKAGFGSAEGKSFNAAKSFFDIASNPQVKNAVSAAAKNPAIQSAVISAARNEQVGSAALNAVFNSSISTTTREQSTCKTENFNSGTSSNINTSKSGITGCLTSGYSTATSVYSSFPATPSYLVPTTNPYDISQFANRSNPDSTTNFHISETGATSSIYPNLLETSDFQSTLSNTSYNQQSFRFGENQPSDSQTLRSEVSLSKTFQGKKPPPRPPPPIFSKIPARLTGQCQSPTSDPYAVVKYPFKAANPEELTCQPQDIVILKKEVSDQWINALNTRSGETGIVPINFIDVKIPLVPTVKESFQSPTVNRKECYARALYDYKTGFEGDLSFSVNDKIKIIEKVNNDWLKGEIGYQKGIFPSSYVKIEDFNNSFGGNTTTTVIPKESPEILLALYDYNSEIAEDLKFRKGDVIILVEKVNSEWVKGRLGNNIGLVPLTFVQLFASSNFNTKKSFNSATFPNKMFS